MVITMIISNQYLVSFSKKRKVSNIAHIPIFDGKRAACGTVYPEFSKSGNWKLVDDLEGRKICKKCLNKIVRVLSELSPGKADQGTNPRC